MSKEVAWEVCLSEAKNEWHRISHEDYTRMKKLGITVRALETPPFDYRKILKAYIQFVGAAEGTSFIGFWNGDVIVPPGLTEAEALELANIDKEVNDE